MCKIFIYAFTRQVKRLLATWLSIGFCRCANADLTAVSRFGDEVDSYALDA